MSEGKSFHMHACANAAVESYIFLRNSKYAIKRLQIIPI